MLSRVNEDDVAEFIEGYTQPTPAPTPQVIVAESEEEPDNSKTYLLAGLAVLAFIAGAYYIKIYKPKHEEDDYDGEGMELDDSDEEADDDG